MNLWLRTTYAAGSEPEIFSVQNRGKSYEAQLTVSATACLLVVPPAAVTGRFNERIRH